LRNVDENNTQLRNKVTSLNKDLDDIKSELQGYKSADNKEKKWSEKYKELDRADSVRQAKLEKYENAEPQRKRELEELMDLRFKYQSSRMRTRTVLPTCRACRKSSKM